MEFHYWYMVIIHIQIETYQEPELVPRILKAYTLPAKSLEYSANTMQPLAFDILIYCKWLGTNHK